jgi:hypothetical protein
MARNLILLMAILAAGGFAAPAPAQTINANYGLHWDDWGIIIDELKFTTSVTRYGQEEEAGSSSIFVYLELYVSNRSHKGKSFIPQNTLKIIVGDNEFDAADLDERVSYVRNIEPTLGESRKCYFQLPRSVFPVDSFIFRFAGLFAKTKDISITPTPTAETLKWLP